jgi:uncharacterized alkaline shock family protein YloU
MTAAVASSPPTELTGTGNESGVDAGSGGADAARAQIGRNELGTISITDTVVARIAARAALEHPDAGAAATRILGVEVPGSGVLAGHLGLRGTDLTSLPKTSVDVDGSLAFVDMTISVRWPRNITAVTRAVRAHVIDRVQQLSGVTVAEVQITVAALVTDIPAAPRVH